MRRRTTAASGAVAIPTTAGTARTDPVVMTGRGPNRSSHRPRRDPEPARTTTRPAENAAVTRADRPAGVRGDARGEHREGVVQHAPADDLGDAQHDEHAAEPGLATAHPARPHRATRRRRPVNRSACTAGQSSVTHRSGAGTVPPAAAGPQHPPRGLGARPAPALVDEAAAAAHPGLRQDQLDPLGRLPVPGDRGGDGADLLVAGERRGTSAPARSSSSRPGTRPARAGPARARRAGRRCRTSARSGRSAAPAHAGPAAPGPGRAGPRTGTTGPGGTRSARRPRRPGPDGGPSTDSSTQPPVGRRASTAGGAETGDRRDVPGRDGRRGALAERAAGGQLVGVAAAEGVADLAAAQQPVDLRARRGLGQLGERDQRGQRRVPAAGDRDPLARVPGAARPGRSGPAPGSRSGRRRPPRRAPGSPSPPSGLGERPRAGRVDHRPRRDPLLPCRRSRTCTVSGSLSRPASTTRSRPRRATPTTRAPYRTRSPSTSASGCRYALRPLRAGRVRGPGPAHCQPVGASSFSAAHVDQLAPPGEQPHVMPLAHRRPRRPARPPAPAAPARDPADAPPPPARSAPHRPPPPAGSRSRRALRPPSMTHRSNGRGLYRPAID